MAKHGDIVMSGKSGAKYFFQSWPLRTEFRPLGAVYCVTKRVFANNTYRRAHHEVIFIGQTPNMADPSGYPSTLDHFEEKGANCVCVFPAFDEEDRKRIAEDLATPRGSPRSSWLALHLG